MKNLSFLLLIVVLLVSCTDNRSKPPPKEATSLSDISVNSPGLESGQDTGVETFSIEARFSEFYLGDAEHYLFEDESGKSWDFAGSECTEYDFTRELNEMEADESNQGWGSNKGLQGKWFKLTYFKREQPQYLDGPIARVAIISEATLLEK